MVNGKPIKYKDCKLYKGNLLAVSPLYGKENVPVVFIHWLASHAEVTTWHIQVVHSGTPRMLCGNDNCINHEHMSISLGTYPQEVLDKMFNTRQREFIINQLRYDQVPAEDVEEILKSLTNEELRRLLKG